jgi:DNA-directed RNA polymerase specialized sigma24 family protein
MADRIRLRFPGLQSDDIGDIWDRALFELARLASDGRFKEEGSLESLIWQIVLWRAHDFWRQQGNGRQCALPLDVVMHDAYLFCVDDSISLDELLEAVREAISRLPRRQRAVLEAFAYLGFNRKDEELVSEASKRAGEPLNRTQVLEALSKGLEKVADYLRRRGYK